MSGLETFVRSHGWLHDLTGTSRTNPGVNWSGLIGLVLMLISVAVMVAMAAAGVQVLS